MKKIHQYEYDNKEKEIKQLEEELAKIRLYKGEVAIHQGDNWHDNPILYQTELKETSLMAKIRNLREKLLSYEIIKERTSDMIEVSDILNPNLIKDLDISEDEKMHIRYQQDKVIKKNIGENLVVNSKSKSGFEDIMLYKIAYMIISSKNNVDAKDILLITPNDIYSEIVSTELLKFIPDNISINSIGGFASEYLGEKVSCTTEDKTISDIKSSQSYKDLLDDFLKSYLSGSLVTEDLLVENEVLFTKDEIRTALFNNIKTIPNYEWATMYFINKYKNNFTELSDRVSEKYASMYKKLPFDDPTRKEYVIKANEIRAVFKEKGQKIIKDYFKKLNRKVSDIYSLFIMSLPEEGNMSKLKLDTLKNIKKRKYSVGDLSALLYIKYQLTNSTIFKDHVVISEGQNYDSFLVDTLEKIFNKSGFSIFCRDYSFDGSLDKYDRIELSYDYDNLYDEKLVENSIPNVKIKKNSLKDIK